MNENEWKQYLVGLKKDILKEKPTWFTLFYHNGKVQEVENKKVAYVGTLADRIQDMEIYRSGIQSCKSREQIRAYKNRIIVNNFRAILTGLRTA